jgi:hypothetical protein
MLARVDSDDHAERPSGRGVIVARLHDMMRPCIRMASARSACVLWLVVGCAADHPLNAPACAISSFTVTRSVSQVDRVDLLFVVDDSPLMAQEQALPQREILRMLMLATTGEAEGFLDLLPPIGDLHIGIVSADMGVGMPDSVPGCSRYGDDGVLALGPDCARDDPRYVWSFDGYHDPVSVAAAVSCRTQLGAAGCSVVQPLEAALKALTPASGTATDFLDGTLGHGGAENGRFLRSDPVRGLSMIIVVVITNQDDCSTGDPRLFAPADQPDPGNNALGLRCALEQNRLHAIQRYVDGLRGLRPGDESLVNFVVIAGVPSDLTSAAKNNAVIFWDTASRNAYYEEVLNDPRMQVRAAETPGQPGASLAPSCSSAVATAYPPRRLVEMARQFGENTALGSICDAKPGDTLHELLGRTSLGRGGIGLCLQHRMVRDRAGTVACRMTWELPLDPDPDQLLTPTACDQRPGVLSTPQAGFARMSSAGRMLCEVRQAPIVQTTGGAVLDGEGFYYDDFTGEPRIRCPRGGSSFGFSQAARPPSGVTVHLDCSDDIQRPASEPRTISESSEPTIGSACDRLEQASGVEPLRGDAACVVPGRPDSLFCHPERNVCVRACELDAQCPTGWVCDASESGYAKGAGRAICVNPGCALAN